MPIHVVNNMDMDRTCARCASACKLLLSGLIKFKKMAVEGTGRMQVMEDLDTVDSPQACNLRIEASCGYHAEDGSYKIDPDALPETCKHR